MRSLKKKMIKLIKKNNSLQSLGTKIIFYLKNYHAQRMGLRLMFTVNEAK